MSARRDFHVKPKRHKRRGDGCRGAVHYNQDYNRDYRTALLLADLAERLSRLRAGSAPPQFLKKKNSTRKRACRCCFYFFYMSNQNDIKERCLISQTGGSRSISSEKINTKSVNPTTPVAAKNQKTKARVLQSDSSFLHKKRGDRAVASESGGERGIRTPGGLRLNGFQDRRNRPLCHLSVQKMMRTMKGIYPCAGKGKEVAAS